MLGDHRPSGITLILAAFAFGGAITGWILVELFREHVDAARLARFTGTILPNETIGRRLNGRRRLARLAILRDVEADAPPVTFVFYPPPPFSVELDPTTLRSGTPLRVSVSLKMRLGLATRNHGQPESDAARAVVFAPVTRNERRARLGECESNGVG